MSASIPIRRVIDGLIETTDGRRWRPTSFQQPENHDGYIAYTMQLELVDQPRRPIIPGITDAPLGAH